MVKSRKQSKRVSLKDKYKIDKKIKEHRRKVRAGSKLPKKLNKDPGVPNLWPFKEQLLEQAQRRKERIETEAVRQKEARKKVKANARRAAMETQDQMADLARQADRSAATFAVEEEERLAAAPEEGLLSVMKDTSKKAFYKDFRKVVEQADVILEVLDARDPLGCRCTSVEQAILKKDGRKKIVLVLNKIDLVPRDVVEKWRQYLKYDLPTVVFKSSTQSQKSHLRQANVAASDASDGLRESSECLGADALMKLLKNYCRVGDAKTSITVGVVGYPNVGKSSLINSLKRERVCRAGAMAGTTRSTQEISLDTNIKLIDCPGIVFSTNDLDANIILRNCVDVRRIKDPFQPVELIRQRCQDAQLMALYEIPAFNNTTEFLAHIAVRKNKMRPGGAADLEGAARALLQDWNTGVIAFYTVPPARMDPAGTHLGAAIVSEAAPALDLDRVLEEQASVVAAMPAAAGREYVAMAPGRVDEGAFDAAMLDAGDEGDEEESMDADGEAAMCEAPGPATDTGALMGLDMHKVARAKRKGEAAGAPRRGGGDDSGDDDALNPQTNRTRRKAQQAARKKSRKQSKKGVRGGGMEVEGGGSGSGGGGGMEVEGAGRRRRGAARATAAPYDFERDFTDGGAMAVAVVAGATTGDAMDM